MDQLKQLGLTVVGVIIGVAILWSGYSLYQDHVFIVALQSAAQRMQAQQQMPKPEMPAAVPSQAVKK